MGFLSGKKEQLFKEFVENGEKQLIVRLKESEDRFPGGERFVQRYRKAASDVLSEGVQKLSHFHETHNELCVAAVILEDKTEPKVVCLQYEPVIDSCSKRFDFHITMSKGPDWYLEIKTIKPTAQDAWHSYESHLEKNRFPSNTKFVIKKDRLVGEIYHNAYASRKKFLDYALEVEVKIETCLKNIGEKTTFLVLFSDGFDWEVDELEDFIYFYQNNTHVPGDPFAKMEDNYVKVKGVIFEKSINHFAFFQRPKVEVQPNLVVWDVKAPCKLY